MSEKDLTQFTTSTIINSHNIIQACKFVIDRINEKTHSNPSEQQKKTIAEMERHITTAEQQIDKFTGERQC
jgi:hypothetical protein